MSEKQQLFIDINNHLLQDKKPSIYFNNISSSSLFMNFPFIMLYKLKETEQSPKYHPEGSVWNHTMLVVDNAAQVKDKASDVKVFMWAALLHDIGKLDTTKNCNGKITSYDHDKVGAKLAENFLKEFACENNFIEKVARLVRWHMQILFVLKSLPFEDIKKMKEQVDINEVALLGFCDRMGRLGADREKEEANMSLFLQKCK